MSFTQSFIFISFFQFSLPCNHFVNYSTDSLLGADGEGSSDVEQVIPLNIEETMAVLTRCSFDEYLRQPIFLLGGIRAIAELIQVSIFFIFVLVMSLAAILDNFCAPSPIFTFNVTHCSRKMFVSSLYGVQRHL